MRQSASPPPRPESTASWVPLVLLFGVAMGLWFVTTFVVLIPLLIHDATHESSTGLAQAVAVLMVVIFQLLFVLFLVASARAALTAPGDIPSWLRSDGKSDLHSYSNLLQAVERKRDGSPRFCRKTGAYKPDRAHYCPEVGRCVLQFQAFSTPLNSAVGFYNYKFYLLSVFYGTLCAAWVVASTLPEVIATGAPLVSVPRDPALLQEGMSALVGQLHNMAIPQRADRPSQWMVRPPRHRPPATRCRPPDLRRSVAHSRTARHSCLIRSTQQYYSPSS